MEADLAVYEQYLHELVNGHRIEAGLAPVAWSDALAAAAREQAQAMSAMGALTHTGADGSTPVGRMRKAGYAFEGRWAGAENVAWKTAAGPDSLAWDVGQLDRRFITSDKHVRNRLDPRFRQMGVGLHLGPMPSEPVALLASEAYAVSGQTVFLTGVAFRDLNGDDAFQPGEEVVGVEIEAVPRTGGEPVRRRARAGGGYDLPLRPGAFTLRAFGPDGDVVATIAVVLADANRKIDLTGPPPAEPRTIADVRAVSAGLAFRVRIGRDGAPQTTAVSEASSP